MNAVMEAMGVLAEIESMKKANRDPEAVTVTADKPGSLSVKDFANKRKFKLHTGKDLTPKQRMQNLKTLHDVHRTAADARRWRAQNTGNAKNKEKHLKLAAAHDARADKHRETLLKMAA